MPLLRRRYRWRPT